MNNNALTTDPFLGQVIFFAGNFAPRGWAFCDGQLLAISQNQALFAILGTTYGGDGRTSFGLPDLRGAFPVHPGQRPGQPLNVRWGEKGGSAQTTLQAANLPAHTHNLAVSNAAGDSNDPTGRIPANTGTFDNEYADADSATGSLSTVGGSTGGNQAFNNMPPYTGIHAIIALQGIFPSRS